MAKECRRSSFDYYKRPYFKILAYRLPDNWLLRSWPWWLAGGLIIVPFLAGIWLQECLLALGVLIGLRFFSSRTRGITNATILVMLGSIWGALWGQSAFENALPENLIKKEVWANGTVQNLPQQRARALRFKFKIDSLEYDSRHYAYSGDVLLNWYKPYPELKIGQRWRLKLRLKPAHGSLNPGGFNYEQWLFSQGIRSTGYVRDTHTAVLLQPAGPAFRVDQFRTYIKQFIDSQGLKYGGLLNALSVGVRTGISDTQWQVFRNTGTAHLIAISGLHIGMVAGIAYFLGNLLWRHTLLVRTHYPAQRVALLMAIMAAIIYAALAGFSLPTLRALLMLIAYLSLQLLRRNSGNLFSLGFVLLVVLLSDPLAPLGAGFWLSFAAVTAIALATRKKHASFRDEIGNSVPPSFRKKFKRRFNQWWQIQSAVFIGLLPFTLFFFQKASIVTLFANFIAIPVIASFVVPLILLALVSLSLNLTTFSAGLLAMADKLIEWLWPVLQTLSEWPCSIWESAAPALWAMLVCMMGAIVWLTPALGKARALGALGFFPLFLNTSPELEPGSFKLHILDVGQGLAVVVETQGHALLYDAGIKYPSGFDSGSAIVLPFLRQRRISHLDTVVASHDNLDHTGGLKSVFAEHPAAKRYASAGFYPLSEPCRAGIEWQWEGINFTFLHPTPDNRKSDNNDSCVLKVESGFGSALLTGDIEHESEQELLQNAYNKIKDTDVLLMPHHGSKTSSTALFLDAVKPQLAIVSAGYLNRFKHPHEKILARYAAENIPILNTADSGWVGIDFSREGIHATPWRTIYKRYWLALIDINSGITPKEVRFQPHTRN